MDILRGRNLKQRAINFVDELWDRRLGIRTFGYHPGSGRPGQPEWQVHYTPAPYARLFKSFNIAGLNKNDSYVDLGSGLGRTVFAASYFGVAKAAGVEIVADLADQADRNRRGKYPNVSFHCMSASDFQFDSATVVFMFHPFGEDTLRKVVKNLERSRQTLRIIYMNPVCENVLNDTPWLEHFATLPARASFALASRYEIKFWRAKTTEA